VSREGDRYTYRYDVTANDRQGPAELEVIATDVAGNVTRVTNETIVVDTISPVISGLPTTVSYVSTGNVELKVRVTDAWGQGVLPLVEHEAKPRIKKELPLEGVGGDLTVRLNGQSMDYIDLQNGEATY